MIVEEVREVVRSWTRGKEQLSDFGGLVVGRESLDDCKCYQVSNMENTF